MTNPSVTSMPDDAHFNALENLQVSSSLFCSSGHVTTTSCTMYDRFFLTPSTFVLDSSDHASPNVYLKMFWVSYIAPSVALFSSEEYLNSLL